MYKTWDPRDSSNTTMWHIYRQWGSWQEVRSMTPDPDDVTSSQEFVTTVGVTSTLGVTFADPEVTSTKAVSTELVGPESEVKEKVEEKPQAKAEKPLVKTTLALMKSFKKKIEAQKTEIKKHELEKAEAQRRELEQKPEVAKMGGKASFKKKANGLKSEVKKQELGKVDVDKRLEQKHDEQKKSSLKRGAENLDAEKRLHQKHEEPKKLSFKRNAEKLDSEKRLEQKHEELKRPSLKRSDEKLEIEKRLHKKHEEPKKSSLKRSVEKLGIEKQSEEKPKEQNKASLKRTIEKSSLEKLLPHKYEEPKKSSFKRYVDKLGVEKWSEEKPEEPKKSPLKSNIDKPAIEKLLHHKQEESKRSSLKRTVEKLGAEKESSEKPDEQKKASLKTNIEKPEDEKLSLHKREEPKKSSLKSKTEAYLRDMAKPELNQTDDHKSPTMKPMTEKQVVKSPKTGKHEMHKQKSKPLHKLEVIKPGIHKMGVGTRPEVEGKVAQPPPPKHEAPEQLIKTLTIKKMVTLKRPVIPKLDTEPKKVQKREVKDVPDVETCKKRQPEVGTVDYEPSAVEEVTLRQPPSDRPRGTLSRNPSTGSEFEFLNSHAMRIVRTVGQAFEVCHKLSLQMAAQTEEGNEAGSEKSSDENEVRIAQNSLSSQLEQEMMKYIINSPEKATMVDSSPGAEVSTQPQTPDDAFHQAQALLQGVTSKPQQAVGTISSPTSPQLAPDDPFAPSTEDLPLSSHHQMQLLRQQLEQQQQQTQVAIAQVHLLKDQLSAETAARIEAQARTHQLLLQNRELLEHINSLVGRLQELEIKVTGMPSSELGMVRAPPQIPLLSDPTTPTPGKVFLPEFAEMEAKEATLSRIPDDATFENTNIKKEQAESPDSGHKEMSSDSLAYNLSQPETNLWYAPMSKLNGAAGDTSTTSSKRSSTSSTNNNTGVTATSRPSSASFGAFDHQFSPRPLNTTGVNVHGQEFHLQMKTSVSSTGFSSRTSQSTAGIGRADTTTDSSKKIITPAPSQDATGNRLELNVRRSTPKLNPPPKITKRIASRSPSFRTDVSTSPDSSNNNYSSHSSTTSETSLNGGVGEMTKRHSRDSARFSATDENLNRESKELNTLPRMAKRDALSKETADRNMNNLSHSPNTKNSLISAADSTTKLHLSFSDEENTENSEDSGVPPQPQTLDSMTFDEFEALSSS